MDIEEPSKNIEKYHEEDKDRRWMNLGLIAEGFAIATLSLYLANPNLFNALFPVFFLITKVVSYFWGASHKGKD